jgi:hypothetical protein
MKDIATYVSTEIVYLFNDAAKCKMQETFNLEWVTWEETYTESYLILDRIYCLEQNLFIIIRWNRSDTNVFWKPLHLLNQTDSILWETR